MRGVVVILFLVISAVFVKAQNNSFGHGVVDTNNLRIYKANIFVLNGKIISNKKMAKIETETILGIFRSAKTYSEFFDQNISDTGYVVTKKFAENIYRKRFSKLSNEYKQYLRKHDNDDSKVVYNLGGQLIDDGTRDRVLSIYQFDEKFIKRVQFDENGNSEHGPLLTVIQIF